MNETRIIWSNLTEDTEMTETMQFVAPKVADIRIIAKIGRYNENMTVTMICQDSDGLHDGEVYDFKEINWYINAQNPTKTHLHASDFDVIIANFFNLDIYDEVLKFALHAKKPLVCNTANLSDSQMEKLRETANHIPIFGDDMPCFKIKEFIDQAVELAGKEDNSLSLYEDLREGENLPSIIAKKIYDRVSEATGKTVRVHSTNVFAKNDPTSDWRLCVRHPSSPFFAHKKHCCLSGFSEIVRDTLEIAKIMKDKPIKKGEFYTLDEI